MWGGVPGLVVGSAGQVVGQLLGVIRGHHTIGIGGSGKTGAV